MNKPVLLIFYKREHETLRVLEEIIKYKPSTLYLASDGSTTSFEDEKIVNIRKKVIQRIPKEIKIKKRFNYFNEGLAKGVSNAITWFFENEEQGIILEEDCLPNQSFFRFCSEMLDKYENENKIKLISGDCFINSDKYKITSYEFSKYAHIWGWATWKRTWKDYTLFIKKTRIEYDSFKERMFWNKWFKEIMENPLATWDVQLVYLVWKQKGLCVYPMKNMIKNIGFSKEATNTKREPKFLRNLKLEKMSFPLKHPVKIKQNICLDKETFKLWFDKGIINFIPNRIKGVIKKWI